MNAQPPNPVIPPRSAECGRRAKANSYQFSSVRGTAWVLNFVAAGALLCARVGSSAESPDTSWPVSEYVRIGVPDPGKFWTGSDYATFCFVLRGLDWTNRAAFPRLDSTNSGAVFARVINPTNTLDCMQAPVPAADRLRLYQSLLIYLPSILDLYKLSGTDTTFHRETVELAHTHLHLLRLALELDGKPMPGAPPGSPPLHLAEESLTRWSAPYSDPDNYKVPRNGTFSVLGAQAAVTVNRLLPWLGDRTVVPDSERLAAARYLNEDVPPLWVHMVPTTRQGLMQDLETVIARTRQAEVRAQLENLRKQLNAPKDGA
jgi:hypothetical protein